MRVVPINKYCDDGDNVYMFFRDVHCLWSIWFDTYSYSLTNNMQ